MQLISNYPTLHGMLSVVFNNIVQLAINKNFNYFFKNTEKLINDELLKIKPNVYYWEQILSKFKIIKSNASSTSLWFYAEPINNNKKLLIMPLPYFYFSKCAEFDLDIDEKGILNIFIDFFNKTPIFLKDIILDFPNNNHKSDVTLLEEIDMNFLESDDYFIKNLESNTPIMIEI